ncbi:TPA: DEAD/DEAH box helicase family protein, partial [Streptococcus agalactiae]
PIEIESNRIRIEQVKQFPKISKENVIYIKLDTIQGIASDLFTEKENTMGLTEYKENKTVILADEAHHYSASTKKEKDDERSWERTIELILESNVENRLLEFTATIDLENKHVYEKYKDKIIFRYSLDKYILDGYSKNIRRIQSSNKDIDNMMDVILLSEYRRLYAKQMYNVEIKP